MFDGRLSVKPHVCTCGAQCHRISPEHKEKWASGITKELDRLITTCERGLVTHPKEYLLFEIWKIINRCVKEYPRAEPAGKM